MAPRALQRTKERSHSKHRRDFLFFLWFGICTLAKMASNSVRERMSGLYLPLLLLLLLRTPPLGISLSLSLSSHSVYLGYSTCQIKVLLRLIRLIIKNETSGTIPARS